MIVQPDAWQFRSNQNDIQNEADVLGFLWSVLESDMTVWNIVSGIHGLFPYYL